MSNRLPLRDRLRDHPLMAGPEEIPWRPDCGASLDFCECNTALNYEEEKGKVDPARPLLWRAS